MTYSNNLSFNTGDDSSEVNVTIANDFTGSVSVSGEPDRPITFAGQDITLADLIESITDRLPTRDDIKHVLECGGGIPSRNFVKEYDVLYRNPSKYQFENCHDLNVALPGGWDYKDYKIIDPYVGKESGAVVKPILVPIGPPKDLNNEVQQPR